MKHLWLNNGRCGDCSLIVWLHRHGSFSLLNTTQLESCISANKLELIFTLINQQSLYCDQLFKSRILTKIVVTHCVPVTTHEHNFVKIIGWNMLVPWHCVFLIHPQLCQSNSIIITHAKGHTFSHLTNHFENRICEICVWSCMGCCVDT